MEIKTSGAGVVVKIDDQDFHLLGGRTIATYVLKSGKLDVIVGNKRLHNIIMDAKFIDHIDGDRANNTRSNLRLATIQQNNFNRKKSPGLSSQYKGVSWDGRRWVANIRFNRELIYILSSTTDEMKCAQAYDRKAKEFFNEFARLNFPMSAQSNRTATHSDLAMGTAKA